MAADTNGKLSKRTLNIRFYCAPKATNLLVVLNDINHFFHWDHIDTHGKNIS
jgi:hypothetical protein